MEKPALALIRGYKTSLNGELVKMLEKLPPSARQRCARFKRDAPKINYASSRLLLTHILNGDTSILDKIEKGESGKPFIHGFPDFSITHTEGFAAAGCVNKGEIGIDAERIRDIELEDFEDYLTEMELTHILAEGEGEAGLRFLRLWTAKEAAMKAAGTGLREPLSDACVYPGYVRYLDTDYKLTHLDIDGYIITLCTTEDAAVDFRILGSIL
ncbi:4'-phosphopantetheinyl transferase family protein [Limisalsivibrio acetivorans]|uniref:4'-phosphopantetheinyl transferase family protein n=1 Tax=Limisalsivibrio acetivorans TaxID=1304888 RepID=UPI0003B408A2|nr:4'-phosphopantetheinyl transferase superfamily protein [Limisalsivibrio acetivorans]